MQGKVQNGGVYRGFDWYGGVYAGRRDDFHIAGGAQELNTAWKRKSGVVVARLPDQREQPRRFQHPHRRHLRRRLSRLERQPVRLRQPLQQLVRLELYRPASRRAGQLVLPDLRRQRRRRSQQSLALERGREPAHVARPQQRAISTSSAPACSRASSCGAATSCCSAGIGNATGCARTAPASGSPARGRAARAARQQPDRKPSTRSISRTCRPCSTTG